MKEQEIKKYGSIKFNYAYRKHWLQVSRKRDHQSTNRMARLDLVVTVFRNPIAAVLLRDF